MRDASRGWLRRFRHDDRLHRALELTAIGCQYRSLGGNAKVRRGRFRVLIKFR